MRRVWRVLRENGVIDGVWTLAASVGSKLQAMIAFAVAGQLAGLDGVGQVVLSISLGTLVASFVDFGLSTQVTRVAASGEMTNRQPLKKALFIRCCASIAATTPLAWAMYSATYSTAPLPFAASTGIYSACFASSLIATQAAYGFGRFRGGAALNGTVRTLSIPLLVVTAFAHAPVFVLVVILALGELIIAILQYRALPKHGADPQFSLLSPRQTWPYATGPMANALMNRSDTVIVAAFATATVVGVYGLASQVQNALTTLALVPAGAAVAYAARGAGGATIKRQSQVLALVVGVSYVCVSTPVFVFPSEITRIIFGLDGVDTTALRICLVAGVFSCVGGVAMQLLSGVGDRRGVASIWIVTAVIAVVCLAGGAAAWGAVGAAFGALLRDLVFFSLSWGRLIANHVRKNE